MNNRIKLLSFIILLLTTSVSFVFSQHDANKEVTEGREYWLGVPHCRIANGESIRFGEFPIMLWLSSKVDTKADVSADAIGYYRTFDIKKNKTTIVELSDLLMCRESEDISDNGVHVISKDPITVCVYVAYKWSGEAFRCIPVEWLGKEYVTTNLYLDKTDKYKPGQTLIIATADRTTVKYYPTANTVEVDAGKSKTVTMNKGQTMLIEGRIEGMEGFVQDWISDMSGTYIKADKPIAVISGHTKGCFPRYKGGYSYFNFARNMLTEMIWPMEILGTEYISAPLLYEDRKRGLSGVQDDFGDLIRFVAAYDDTEIYQMRQDGTGYMKISKKMKRGEWHDITNQEQAALYRSTKPVLAAQYGKTWWNGPGITNEKDKDKPLNPSRNGQGFLLVLTPIDHWCSYSQFRSPTGINNFIYFTFKEEALNHIRFDGTAITTLWGSAVHEIHGSDYLYIEQQIPPGDHWFEADSGYQLASYAYGTWDYYKDGFAYGYPTGINYAISCTDSLFILDSMHCGEVEGTAYVVPEDSSCAIIFSVDAYDLDNYIFEVEEFDRLEAKQVAYWLHIQDINKPAYGRVTVVSRSGLQETKEYWYWPEEIEAVPTSIDFGTMKPGDKVCEDILLRNPNKDSITITVHDIKLKMGKPEFVIDPESFPFTLGPGEEKTIKVCATATEDTPDHVEDSIIVVLNCFEKAIVELELNTGNVDVVIKDALWERIPLGREVPHKVLILNEGSLPAEIYSIDWDDKQHFTKVEDLNFPIFIEPDAFHQFTVYYKPEVEGQTDIDTAYFTANTDGSKLYSIWIGDGILAGPYISGYDWPRERVIDDFSINDLGITEYPATVTIENTSKTGEQLDVIEIKLENDFGGVFRLDASMAPKELKSDNPVDLDVFFAPDPDDAFVTYETKIFFIARFDGKLDTAVNYLRGSEKQPHFNITGEDYGPALLVDDSKDGFGEIYSVIDKEATKMELTIFSIDITDDTDNAFEIDPAFISGITYPYVLAAGEELKVPIKFTAKHPGDHTAKLVADHDAPEDLTGDLIGRGRTEGLSTTDAEWDPLFITLTGLGQTVELRNSGSDPVTITEPIMITGTNPNEFNLYKWNVEGSGVDNPQPPFELPGGGVLICEVIFTPQDVMVYDAQIDYTTEDLNENIGVLTSHLTGEGMVLKTIARIPDHYVLRPDTFDIVDVYIDKHPDEEKALEEANIMFFECVINFKSEGRENVQDVMPMIAGVEDILTDNRMTEGWDVNAIYLDSTTLRVALRSNDKPLSGSGKLFGVPFMAFLSDLDVIPLHIEFNPQNTPWVIVDTIPGQIVVDPVCVNTLRLIELASSKYSLSLPTPNPVGDRATINYSIGFNGKTEIEMYDSYGNKVAILVNQYQNAGKYEFTIDVNSLDLPSGVYQYRMRSGNFEDNKQIVISK